jgi:hypothetical protein
LGLTPPFLPKRLRIKVKKTEITENLSRNCSKRASSEKIASKKTTEILPGL